MPKTFGKVKQSYKLLFAPTKSMELGFDQFETLCLKASPASLKELCRQVVRSSLNYSQANIKSLNATDRPIVPLALVNFLKYPSHLRVGECLLCNEKLVSDDDTIEIELDKSTGHMVIWRRNEAKQILAYNVDFVWLHRFHTVYYDNKSSQAKPVHLIYDNLVNYKLSFDFDKGEPMLVL